MEIENASATDTDKSLLTAWNDDLEATIAKLEGTAPETVQEVSKAEEKVPEKAEDEEKVQEKPAPVARALAQLSAREAKIAEREKALEAAEKAAKEKELAEKGAPKAAVPGNVAVALRRDPVGYIKSLGFSDEEAASVFRAGMADILGDKAPEGYRQLKANSALEARFKELELQNAELKAAVEAKEQAAQAAQVQASQAQIVQAYQADVIKYATGDEGKQGAPLVARALSDEEDRSEAMQELMGIVMEDARAKLARGERGAAPLTPAEAIAELEKRYKKFQKRLGLDSTPSQVEQKKVTPSLNNRATTPSVAQTTKTGGNEPFDLDKATAAALEKHGLK
jgi:hypothetical protein